MTLGLAQPAAAGLEQVADAAAVTAEVAGGLGMIDEGRGREMRVAGADAVDQRP